MRLSHLDEPLDSASIHGVISSLSPVKKWCKSNYFDGSVSDGKSKVGLVGFSPLQRMRMKTLMEKKQAVKLEDCKVRHARRGQKMEIVLKGSTKIGASPKKFDFSNILIEDEITPPSDVESKGVYDRVSVHQHCKKDSAVKITAFVEAGNNTCYMCLVKREHDGKTK